MFCIELWHVASCDLVSPYYFDNIITIIIRPEHYIFASHKHLNLIPYLAGLDKINWVNRVIPRYGNNSFSNREVFRYTAQNFTKK